MRDLVQAKVVAEAAHDVEHHVDVGQRQTPAVGLQPRLFNKNVEIEREAVPRQQRVAILNESSQVVNHPPSFRSRHLRSEGTGVSSVPERLMLAVNTNGRSACDAQRSMRKQVWHLLWKKLCRFDIEREESPLHGVGFCTRTLCRGRSAALVRNVQGEGITGFAVDVTVARAGGQPAMANRRPPER